MDFTIRSLGSQEELLRSLAASQPITIPNAFSIGDIPAGVQVKGTEFITWLKLPELNISGVFNLGPENTVYAVFKKAPVAGTTEFDSSFKWNPNTAGMSVYFVATFQQAPGGAEYVQVQSHMIARARTGKQNRKPPFPNIYPDGRVCMGNGFGNVAATLSKGLHHAVNHFLTSRWNSDLADHLSQELVRSVFSWKSSGEQIPTPEGFEWHRSSACPVINNQYINDLPL